MGSRLQGLTVPSDDRLPRELSVAAKGQPTLPPALLRIGAAPQSGSGRPIHPEQDPHFPVAADRLACLLLSDFGLLWDHTSNGFRTRQLLRIPSSKYDANQPEI